MLLIIEFLLKNWSKLHKNNKMSNKMARKRPFIAHLFGLIGLQGQY